MAEIAVVTGGTAGVGRAVARRLAAEGTDVAILARGWDRLDATADELRDAGVRALALEVDVADDGAVEEAADEIERELGPIDVWINNAMATLYAPVHEIEPAEFRRATEVTYLGTVWGTMAALRRMRPRDRGTIVQVGSALAYRGIPLQSPYCGAKHAIQGFTESLRTELLHEGSRVRLTMVQLPAHNTPQFSWGRTKMPRHPQPVPPIFQPEVAAEAIVHAARRPRREFFVAWPTWKVVLGNRLVPGYVDRYLARHGFDDQQTAEPVDPGRPDNLFEPVPGEFAAHGEFDAQAKSGSALLWASLHRRALAVAAAAGVGAAVARLITNEKED
ncbi:MAG: SDR family oxidoreductase [Actinomycetota bacterium]|nr:SDR family oxidoreductase [Actinomycetota bacterium]